MGVTVSPLLHVVTGAHTASLVRGGIAIREDAGLHLLSLFPMNDEAPHIGMRGSYSEGSTRSVYLRPVADGSKWWWLAIVTGHLIAPNSAFASIAAIMLET